MNPKPLLLKFTPLVMKSPPLVSICLVMETSPPAEKTTFKSWSPEDSIESLMVISPLAVKVSVGSVSPGLTSIAELTMIFPDSAFVPAD